jgi:hypothetical protein
LLKSSTDEVREKAAGVTWILCKDFKHNQDAFHLQDVATLITNLLSSENISVQEQALVATLVLCDGHSDNQEAFYKAGCALVFHKLLLSSIASVQEKSAAALYVLCKDCAKFQASFGESGCVQAVCNLLRSPNDAVQLSAIDATSALSYKHFKNQDAFHIANCFHALVPLLSSPDTFRSRRCCLAIQSICDEHPENCFCTLNAGAISMLLPLLSCSDSELCEEARNLVCTLVLYGGISTEPNLDDQSSGNPSGHDLPWLHSDMQQFRPAHIDHQSTNALHNSVDIQSLLDDHNRIGRECLDLQKTLEHSSFVTEHNQPDQLPKYISLRSRGIVKVNSENADSRFLHVDGMSERLMAKLDENAQLRRAIHDMEDSAKISKCKHVKVVENLKFQIETQHSELAKVNKSLVEEKLRSEHVQIKER